MEIEEQIQRFKEFLEKQYYAELLEKARKGEYFIVIEFQKLARFNIQLAEHLLDNPEETIKIMELSIEEFDIKKPFKVRIKDLGANQKVMIKDIRSVHLNKLLAVEGIVRQKSDVRPQITAARFECPNCGNVITVLQLDTKLKEPTMCGCGRKGRFILKDKELIDAQRIVLEEATEDLEGGEQPKKLNVLLKADLVSPITDKKTNPGAKIRVNGILKEVPIILRSGSQSTTFDIMIDANYAEPMEESFVELTISKEELKEIKELSQDPKVLTRLIKSVVPSIYGYEMIKEALILQLMGGVRKTRKDGVVTRGDIHVLLIGDPGSGKSQMLKRIAKIAPKGRFISGKGVSGAGLTAAVVKDEFLQGWALEAGALVLASGGICCTTEDSEFILENGKRMDFKELFENERMDFIHPKFKIMAFDKKDLKIKPFRIKKAMKLKNNKIIYSIKTRTGRKIKLTSDNEVLICRESKLLWDKIEDISKGDFIAVSKNISIPAKDDYSEKFAYICGLVGSDGTIKLNSRRGGVYFYNSDKNLAEIFKKNVEEIGFPCSVYIQKKGRKSSIRGKEFFSKKDVYNIYNSTKEFANKVIEFGIPSGNKSTKRPFDKKIVGYSKKTMACFLKGIFDGDGSIRLNPIEITLTTGMEQNARLFQEILTLLGIISSVKKSTNSWHCEVRGASSCLKFLRIVGTNHKSKEERFLRINPKEVKDRIDILPNHQEFFKNIINDNRGKLGKKLFKYFWNYSKKGVFPSKEKLATLNKILKNSYISNQIESDVLWDKIEDIKKENAEYVYDFTMEGTDNFIANDIIMHNCIDELDKISPDDRSAMHEALEGQTVTISKANIQATLRAETTVLAAANPKFGRFNPYGNISDQIDLPPTLINRFDLIFTVKDVPDRKKDDMMATFILNLHQNPDFIDQDIDTTLLRKYIAFARQNIAPKLTDSAMEEIKDYYLKTREMGKGESGTRSIPITTRQLEGLVRLSEAAARVRLGSKVTKKDATVAIELLDFCLRQIAMNEEGVIDIDKIATGITTPQRSAIMAIKEIIDELENETGKLIPVDDIMRRAMERNIDRHISEDIIEKLKRAGDLFEPKRDFISKV